MSGFAPAALRVSLAFGPDAEVAVGRLALDRGRAVLEYDADFIRSGLSLNPRFARADTQLLWAREPRLFEGLHGVFADSLPDAWGRALMDRHARARGIDPASLSILDRLAVVGRRGMGALVYEPAAPADAIGAIDLDALSREALDVLGANPGGDASSTLEELGESSGGARPKILVAIDAAGNLRAGGDVVPRGFEAWIVKFRAPRDRPDSGPLEATYAEMARAAGVTVATTTLLSSRKHRAGYFATKRFDRGPNGARFHVLSMAGLLETQWEIPTIDYDGLLRATRLATRHEADVEQMFRRMVFNIAAHNRDDHTKQHAFVMGQDGEWRLAPAYDLTFSSGPGGEHYLTVNGRGQGITGEDIRAVAAPNGIRDASVRAIVDDVASAVSRFDALASEYGVARSSRAEVGAVLSQRVDEIRSAAARAQARRPRR